VDPFLCEQIRRRAITKDCGEGIERLAEDLIRADGIPERKAGRHETRVVRCEASQRSSVDEQKIGTDFTVDGCGSVDLTALNQGKPSRRDERHRTSTAIPKSASGVHRQAEHLGDARDLPREMPHLPQLDTRKACEAIQADHPVPLRRYCRVPSGSIAWRFHGRFSDPTGSSTALVV
jgi:hypothetical protein